MKKLSNYAKTKTQSFKFSIGDGFLWFYFYYKCCCDDNTYNNNSYRKFFKKNELVFLSFVEAPIFQRLSLR